MVIQIIYQFDIITDKSKNYTPVAIAPYREKAFLFTSQRMQSVSREVDIFRYCCYVQQTKYPSQLGRMFGLDTGFTSGSVKLFQPSVTKTFKVHPVNEYPLTMQVV